MANPALAQQILLQQQQMMMQQYMAAAGPNHGSGIPTAHAPALFAPQQPQQMAGWPMAGALPLQHAQQQPTAAAFTPISGGLQSAGLPVADPSPVPVPQPMPLAQMAAAFAAPAPLPAQPQPQATAPIPESQRCKLCGSSRAIYINFCSHYATCGSCTPNGDAAAYPRCLHVTPDGVCNAPAQLILVRK